jgi:C4-type Zn-finger protein
MSDSLGRLSACSIVISRIDVEVKSTTYCRKACTNVEEIISSQVYSAFKSIVARSRDENGALVRQGEGGKVSIDLEMELSRHSRNPSL